MQRLHPLVSAILEGLLRSPLAALAIEARERLSEGPRGFVPKDAGQDDDGQIVDAERGPFAWSDDPRDGLDQLGIVETVIGTRLRREIDIATRLPALAERLGLDALNVQGVGSTTRADIGDVRGLVAPGRRKAVEAFSISLDKAVERARVAILQDLEGLR